MNRRAVLMGIAASRATGQSAQPPGPSSADDVRAAIRNYYAVWESRDVSRYRALVTGDYMLLENGERMTVEDDVRMMPKPGAQRTDVFDFRATEIVGEIAYAHWFLESKIVDEKGSATRRWLESGVLRRLQGIWKVALLHSTRIEKK